MGTPLCRGLVGGVVCRPRVPLRNGAAVRQAEYPPWDGAPYFDAGPDRVDVNTAPAAELETLPGIGEKKALAIVEYREANGPFRAVEELERVKGISERTVDGMRAYVRVS